MSGLKSKVIVALVRAFTAVAASGCFPTNALGYPIYP